MRNFSFLLLAMFAFLPGCCSVESQFLRVPRSSWATPDGVEDLWIEADDDGQMHGWMFRPADSLPTEKIPAIVFMHGRSDTMADYREIGQAFADATHSALLIFEYRGFGKSSDLECISRATMVNDGKAVLEELRSRDDVNSEHIALWGVSLGAYPALACFVDDSAVDALVLWGAPANINTVIDDGHEALSGFNGIIAKLFIQQFREPETEIKNAGCRPILIVHGANDKIVRVRNAQALATAAQSADVPVILFVDPTSTHSQISQEAVNKITKFFLDNLTPET